MFNNIYIYLHNIALQSQLLIPLQKRNNPLVLVGY